MRRPSNSKRVRERFPNITVMGNPLRTKSELVGLGNRSWNPNVSSISADRSLKKLGGRLGDISKYFWWTSNTDEGTDTPDNNPSAFTSCIRFGYES